MRIICALVLYTVAALMGAPAWAAFFGATILAYQMFPERRPD